MPTSPELSAPELHVIALAHAAATDDAMLATVFSVMLARRGSNSGDVIQPLKTTELTAQYQNLAGTAFKGTGVVAVSTGILGFSSEGTFPMS